LIVDAARMPVYVVSDGARIMGIVPTIAIATAACVAGTIAGERILGRIPWRLFRRLVALLVLGLGIYMLWRGIANAR
jgi:uncharacterized membrane protein YfcA